VTFAARNIGTGTCNVCTKVVRQAQNKKPMMFEELDAVQVN